jgi:hypothetical protein
VRPIFAIRIPVNTEEFVTTVTVRMTTHANALRPTQVNLVRKKMTIVCQILAIIMELA